MKLGYKIGDDTFLSEEASDDIKEKMELKLKKKLTHYEVQRLITIAHGWIRAIDGNQLYYNDLLKNVLPGMWSQCYEIVLDQYIFGLDDSIPIKELIPTYFILNKEERENYESIL